MFLMTNGLSVLKTTQWDASGMESTTSLSDSVGEVVERVAHLKPALGKGEDRKLGWRHVYVPIFATFSKMREVEEW